MSDGLTYALVARGVVILAEYSTTTADYTIATAPILESLAGLPQSLEHHQPERKARIFIHGSHRIHVLSERGLVFLAVAEAIFPSYPVQSMLERLVKRFIEIYGDGWEMPLITIPFSVSDFAAELKRGVEQTNEVVKASSGMRSKSVMIDPLVEESLEEIQALLRKF